MPDTVLLPNTLLETDLHELEEEKDVQSSAQSALAASPIFVLRDLSVRRSGNSLHLSGEVDSFYHKQLAQEVVRSVARGVPVVNSIAVNYFDE